jgi:hypothetical protein
MSSEPQIRGCTIPSRTVFFKHTEQIRGGRAIQPMNRQEHITDLRKGVKTRSVARDKSKACSCTALCSERALGKWEEGKDSDVTAVQVDFDG